jgi:hypothetical protein
VLTFAARWIGARAAAATHRLDSGLKPFRRVKCKTDGPGVVSIVKTVSLGTSKNSAVCLSA